MVREYLERDLAMRHVNKMKHKIKHRNIKYKKEKNKSHVQGGVLIVMAIIFVIAVGFAYISFTMPQKLGEKAGTINQPQPNCLDSDGGRIYGVKGTTSMRNGPLVYTDSCSEVPQNSDVPVVTTNAVFNDANNGNIIPIYYWLQEYYCSGDSVVSEYFRCPNGCSNGACTGYIDCTDSDGGKNVYVKGTVVFHEQNQSDFCDGEPQHTGIGLAGIEIPVYNLTEMYCENNAMQYVHLTCPDNKECKEGRCVNASSNNTLRANPSSITVLVGQNATSTISGGIMPYVISKYPDSTIASAWLSGGLGAYYTLTVYGRGVGLTDVSITDSSPEDSMISVPIIVSSTSNPLKSVPSSITVLVGQNATSTISGGIVPYILSKLPDSTIAKVWLRGIGGTSGYTLTVYGISVGSTDVAITDSSPEDATISVPITVMSNASTPLKANPSSITVLVGGNATSTISGGIAPYTISKMPNSVIADALLMGYTLTVYGRSAGYTDVAVTDSSSAGTTISIPITVILGNGYCSKTGSVCTDSNARYTDYCSSETILNNYTCNGPGGISPPDSCTIHQEDCRAQRGSTGYCNNLTKQCEDNQSQVVDPDLIVYSIDRINYSGADGLRIVVKNIGGNANVASNLLVNVTSAGMNIYGLMDTPAIASHGNYTLDIPPAGFGIYQITGKTILVDARADYLNNLTELLENNNYLSVMLSANACSSWVPKNVYGVDLKSLGLEAPEEMGFYNLTMEFSYNGKIMSRNSELFEVVKGNITTHHHECNDNYQCVQVSGTGDNDCSSNSDCSYGGNGGGNYTCTESWVYTAWSGCINGVDQRTCYDQRTCGTTRTKPANCVLEGTRYVQSMSCQTGQCTENWQCEWQCQNTGYEIKVCTDSNNCGTENYKPAEESRKCGSGNIFNNLFSKWYFWVALGILVIAAILLILFLVILPRIKKKKEEEELTIYGVKLGSTSVSIKDSSNSKEILVIPIVVSKEAINESSDLDTTMVSNPKAHLKANPSSIKVSVGKNVVAIISGGVTPYTISKLPDSTIATALLMKEKEEMDDLGLEGEEEGDKNKKSKKKKKKGAAGEKKESNNEQEELSKSASDSDAADALTTYVKDAKAAGMKKEEIQEKLLGAGWPQDEVDDAIKTF
jgi:hypothetical protein